MLRLNKKRLALLSFGSFVIFLVAIMAYHEVDNSLTAMDKQYIPKYLINPPPVGTPEDRNYEQELELIEKIQRSVLRVAPENPRIPYDTKRELKQLYEAKSGSCFDRSRVIEKILRYYGFETRHVFVLSTEETRSPLKSLLTPGISSHAVTEVLTKKGWLVVDSNDLWISKDKQNNPLSIEQIKTDMENSTAIPLSEKPPNSIFHEPFIFVYGLYSRHGRFYPPYNFVPDVSYKELAQNIL